MLCFFFFKQKTAYEMRISDWSSDVCSSDLEIDEQAERQIPERIGVNAGIDARPAVRLPPPGDDTRRNPVYRGAREAPADLAPHLRLEPAIEAGVPQSGRKGEGAAGDQIAHANDRGHRKRPEERRVGKKG